MAVSRQFLALLLLLAASGGCSDNGAPREAAVPVAGRVTYKGQPLPRYQVIFAPVDGRRPASGISDENGNFTLSTNAEGDGAPPGMHKVAVAWAGPPATDSTGSEVPIEDPKLMPKQPINVPAKFANPDESGLTQEVPDKGIQDLVINLE